MNNKKLIVAFTFVMVALFAQSAFAQLGLNWEGQTGALLTPFAYTVGAPDNKLGKPELAIHWLNGGDVLGNTVQLSATEGFGKRFEAGFTATLQSVGGSSQLGGELPYFFQSGFTTLHGKYTIVKENSGKTKWVPAIAVGAVGRFGDNRLFAGEVGPISESVWSKTNGDFYVAATKLVKMKKTILLINAGEKVTNASIMGLGGAAGTAYTTNQRYQGNWFTAVGLAFTGPAKSLLVVGVEAVQQPHYIQLLNYETNDYNNIPTTISYFLRIQPKGKPFNIDLAGVHVGGGISQEVNLNANSRFGMGVTYHF
jgi:hypothetical protein